MILPDAKLLLHAINSDSMDHVQAGAWWRNLLESGTEVGLHTTVLFAFVRLSTHRKVFTRPLTVAGAFAYIHNWLEFPNVHMVESEKGDILAAERFLAAAGTGGNLVSDAQIAATAHRLGATIHSADHDFARFPEIRWLNPLESK